MEDKDEEQSYVPKDAVVIETEVEDLEFTMQLIEETFSTTGD